VPAALQGQHDAPNRNEEAAHAALTLFALHQQSNDARAHVPGQSVARAIGLLSRREDRKQAVTRRFMAVVTAQSLDEILVHIRGLVTQLRSENLGFDYSRFAEDLVRLLTPEGAQRVRLAWGRDFYRRGPAPSASDKTPNADIEKE
jgi:CRISPR system Cascade subunit CasB